MPNDEFEAPVPANPKALSVAFGGLPNTDRLESLLAAKGDGNIDPVAPDEVPKVKEAAGFICVLERDVLMAPSSFFPNVNGEAEENEPNVALPGAGVDVERSIVLEGLEFSVA